NWNSGYYLHHDEYYDEVKKSLRAIVASAAGRTPRVLVLGDLAMPVIRQLKEEFAEGIEFMPEPIVPLLGINQNRSESLERMKGVLPNDFDSVVFTYLIDFTQIDEMLEQLSIMLRNDARLLVPVPY